MPARKSNQSGTILILALLLMTATVFFGISYVASSTNFLESQDRAFERLQAQALSEGAIEAAHRHILTYNAGGTERDRELGTGTYGFLITGSAATGFSIVADGSVDGAQVYCKSRVSATVSQTDLTQTVRALGQTYGNMGEGSGFEWGGELDYLKDGVLNDGGSMPLITLDQVAFEADGFFSSGTIVRDQNLPGNTLVSGDMTFNGQTIIEGSLYATGTIQIDGDGNPVNLLADDNSGVLFIEGDLFIQNAAHLQIYGSIFVLGNIVVQNVLSIEGNGSLVCNGDLMFNLPAEASGAWVYDPWVAEKPPACVDGGEQEIQFREEWRRFGQF